MLIASRSEKICERSCLNLGRLVLTTTLLLAGIHSAAAQTQDPGHDHAPGHDHDHDAGHEHPGQPLHFSHPLIAESPSPDTKIRIDFNSLDIQAGDEVGRESGVQLEAEYAFHPSFSIEVDVPWVSLDPEGEPKVSGLGNIGLGFKFANFAFADQGVLLGYGLELGLPTGDDEKGTGSSNLLEVAPFLAVGYKHRKLELVSFLEFGIPTHQNEEKGQEVETELGFNLSALYHVSSRWQALLELDGEEVLSGEEEGHSVLNLTPGVKFRPVAGKSLLVGAGVSFPLSNEEEFDTRLVGSVFYHF